MALPYIKSGLKQKERVLAVDLGGRTTKAVLVERKGTSLTLSSYAMLDAPIFDKAMSAEMLADHLKNIIQIMDTNTRTVTMTVGVSDSIVRHTEMPRMGVDDLRQVLKLSSKTYLQQELTNYLYDCHVLPVATPAKGQQAPKPAPNTQPKHRILVAGAKKTYIEQLLAGARNAGLVAESVVPAMVGPANTFERAVPQSYGSEIVALIDLGFRNSTICILEHGELVMSRVVAIGGDKLTSGLAEMLGISYAEAEGIKVGMPAEVQMHLEGLIIPLGRELRASIDFYEHQNEKTVNRAYVTGGSARSEYIIEQLQSHLMLECNVLNPMSFLELALKPQQMAELEQVAPQLCVALGAALATF